MHAGFTLPSYAKINWTLRILGKREDGFHELCTLFQTVSLHDVIEFSQDELVLLHCDQPELSGQDTNLILLAARALSRRFPEAPGAAIRLTKNIPFPGGLGGGSSNAAVTLIGLNRLWNLGLSTEELQPIAAELGSDVPFFLIGGSAVGTGRGEIVESADDIDAKEILIVTPNVTVSTANAFKALNASALTSEVGESSLTVCRNEARSLDPLHSVLVNDFEPTVFAAHPEINRVRDTFLELGASNAALSGSGASVYAVFDKKETRQAAQKALDQESTWRKFAVSTISRSEYAKALGI